MIVREKILGCLAGLAIGDALGMPTEFMSPEQITAAFGRVDRFVGAPPWHPHSVMRAGQVTDDTGQTLSLARAARLDGRLTAAGVARELLRWADDAGDTLPLILGPSSAKALDALRAGADPRESGRQGKSNGAAYRGIIPGLLNPAGSDNLAAEVVEVCMPTHGTTVAISGAMAVAWAVAAALEEDAHLERILAAARQGAVAGRGFGAWAWGTPLEGRIDLALQIVKDAPTEEAALARLYGWVGVDMLVPESVAAAFGLVALAGGDPARAVVYGANLGGDTDTMAAIAGAVCGAYRGVSAVDPDLLAAVQAVNGLDLPAEAESLAALRAARTR